MLLALLASCGANDVQEAPIANVKEVIEAPIKTEQPPVTPEDTIEVEQKKNEEPPVEVQEVNGKTVEEASEMYFSGSSLTTWAFQKAMKAEIK